MRLVGDPATSGVQNFYCHPSGGGKYIGILQFKKERPTDEGRQRHAALAAFTAFGELKHVILVDEDVDIYNTDDVLWAMTTRFQGDVSTIFIPGVRCHPLDPSESPEYSPSIRHNGVSCKVIYDCTVPFALKKEFMRSPFKEDVDVDHFLKNSVLS
jgi:4-hydroxy-3-polyprenylbenzoate decarboxylase